MAIEEILNLGKKTVVLFERGYWGSTNRPKCCVAPFSLVRVNGDQYLCPTDSTNATTQGARGFAITSDVLNQTSFFLTNCGEWFIDDFMRMGEHEMGDWKGAAGDTWKGVHKFGVI